MPARQFLRGIRRDAIHEIGDCDVLRQNSVAFAVLEAFLAFGLHFQVMKLIENEALSKIFQY
jgi:hypothetical protein